MAEDNSQIANIDDEAGLSGEEENDGGAWLYYWESFTM